MLVPGGPGPSNAVQRAPAAPVGSGTPVAVACRCGRRFAAPPHLAGKQVACPACRSPIQIPIQRSSTATAQNDDDGFWDEIKPSAASPFQAPGGGSVVPVLSPKKAIPTPAKATSYAIERSARGASSNQIRDELAEMGLGPEECMRIVETLHGRDDRAVRSAGGGISGNGMGHLGFGCLLFVGGAIVTVGTYVAAPEGGRFVIAIGPIVWGVIHIFIGLGKSLGAD